MPRPKGSQNKVTAEVKEQLQCLVDKVINSIDIDAMTTDQKLKLLQLSFHYLIPNFEVLKPRKLCIKMSLFL